MNILCIGAGVMSCAFAVAQSGNHVVKVFPSPYDKSTVSSIVSSGKDARLDITWPSIQFVDMSSLGDVDCIVVGVSSQGISWAANVINEILNGREIPIVLLTKGLIKDGDRMTVLSDVLEKQLGTLVHVITGPCIAKQLAHRNETRVEFSSRDEAKSAQLASELSLPYYHFQVSKDYIGCQWAAALKNVYAICIARAGANHNKRSALFERSLHEMVLWVIEAGGLESSVFGLSGVGDLYVTCLGGRNGMLGQHLSTGLSIESIINGPMKGVTVEGLDLAYDLSFLSNSAKKPIFTDLLDVINPS